MQFAGERMSKVLDEMDDVLQNTMWLNGPKLSLANISLAPFVEKFEANHLTRLVDWE